MAMKVNNWTKGMIELQEYKEVVDEIDQLIEKEVAQGGRLYTWNN